MRSAAKAAFARQTGADLVIDVSHEDFVEKVMEWTDSRGADVVIDNLGGDVLARSIEAARAKGVIVVFGFVAGTETTFDIRNFFFAQKELRGSMASDISDLRWGLEQVEAGRIKPLLDRTLPLSRAAEAHRLVAESLVKGSIVLMPWAA